MPRLGAAEKFTYFQTLILNVTTQFTYNNSQKKNNYKWKNVMIIKAALN